MIEWDVLARLIFLFVVSTPSCDLINWNWFLIKFWIVSNRFDLFYQKNTLCCLNFNKNLIEWKKDRALMSIYFAMDILVMDWWITKRWNWFRLWCTLITVKNQLSLLYPIQCSWTLNRLSKVWYVIDQRIMLSKFLLMNLAERQQFSTTNTVDGLVNYQALISSSFKCI